MSFLKRLFSTNTAETTQRVRICVECGMPVADHKDWCSIRRGQAEMERRKAGSQRGSPPITQVRSEIEAVDVGPIEHERGA